MRGPSSKPSQHTGQSGSCIGTFGTVRTPLSLVSDWSISIFRAPAHQHDKAFPDCPGFEEGIMTWHIDQRSNFSLYNLE